MEDENAESLQMDFPYEVSGLVETSQYDENGHVAVVNNEYTHAVYEGAGPKHMANWGAGVNDSGSVSDGNPEYNEEFQNTIPVSGSSTFSFGNEQDCQDSNFSNMLIGEGPDQEEDEDAADAESAQSDLKESKEKEKFNVESLSYELQVGYRILSNMMSASNRCVNKLFLFPVDDSFPETADYYERIKEPMWMFKMKEKFERHEYSDLTQFMNDFRLMMENCYRFNGPDNFVSKKALKLETMMKQKINLLSRDLREKILGAGSSNSEDEMLTSAGLRRRVRNPNLASDDPSQQLLSQLRRDREMQEKVDRKQKVEDRKAMEQARIQELQDWEDKLLGDEAKELTRTMWELPQIGLFVYLCMESLGLEEEVCQYQLERGLAAPKECSDFRRMMTCLLSTPHQRKSLKSFMPYHVWNKKLCTKVDYFYKVLSDKNENQTQACYKLGLDTRAFKVMGKRNPLLKKQFHEISYFKRVWILKNLCDFCMETQPYLQKTIEDVEAVRPSDVREVLLGSDGRGYRYINFPMFTGKDIRIYKHSKHPEPSLESLDMQDWSVEPDKPSNSSSRCSTPINQRSNRLIETPSTSLRARAMLLAAESKEASPMRDTSRSGSEAPDTNTCNSDAQVTLSDNSEISPAADRGKQNNSKKRKRTSLFSSKRKRLKPGVKKDANGKNPSTEKNGDSKEKSLDNGNECEEEGSDIPGSLTQGDTSVDQNNSLAQPACDSAELGNGKDSNRNSSLNNNTHGVQKNAIFEEQTSLSSKPVESTTNISGSCNSEKEDTRFSSSSDRIVKKELDNGSSEGNKFDLKKDLQAQPGSDTKATNMANINSVTEDAKIITIKSENESNEMKKETDCNGDVSPAASSNYVSSTIRSDEENMKANKDAKGPMEASGEDSKSFSGATPVKKEELKNEIDESGVEMGGEDEDSDDDDEDLPVIGRIELVAESMDDIRQLMNKLSNPDPIKRGKRVYPGVIKPCEEELLANLTTFHDELLKYERSLTNARLAMQAKLRKEVETYVEVKIEETKNWDSDHSQSSKDSSDDEDSEPKAEIDTVKQVKKVKSKPASSTTALLSSAASKLAVMDGEGNEDSNDSYELDISSRGRLRKRRIIPNNTEDTGLKKRKNLPNQETFFTTPSTATSPSLAVTTTSPQSQPAKSWPSHIISMLTSNNANSAIKAQLASQTSRTPGQIVRLVRPGTDGTVRTLRVAGKPNVIISPQNFANIRFISSTGIVTVPRNKVIASSSAQSSHPVIQQLLLSQESPKAQATSTTSVLSTKTITPGLLQKRLPASDSGSTAQAAGPTAVKVSLVITVPSTVSSSAKPSIMSSQSATDGAVVVTQVSTSRSHGGKQVLDLGSLSVSQIQQLMKNQAIQINTGAGNPTTLLLTTGLQHLANTKAPGAATTITVGSTSQVKTSVGPVGLQPKVGASSVSSLLSMVNKTPPTAPAPQILLNNKLNPLLTISRQVAPQTLRHQLIGEQQQPHAQVKVSISNNGQGTAALTQGLNDAALQTALARTVPMATPPGVKIISSSSQQPQSKSTSVVGTGQKQLSMPRIISSLTPSASVRVSMAAKDDNPVAQNQKTQETSSVPPANNPWSLASGDVQRPRIITVPLINFSPAKKYASNVTVKALLENRGTKKAGEEDAEIGSSGTQLLSSASVEVPSNQADTDGSEENCILNEMNDNLLEVAVQENDAGNSKTLQVASGTSDIKTVTVAVTPAIPSTSVANSKNLVVVPKPLSLPLSVDTASTSREIILPTVNIKVPSPNTLPSVQHNKNGTTIVQSTKGPIPVASEAKAGDSGSPFSTTTGFSLPQSTALQSVNTLTKQSMVNNKIIIAPATAPSTVRILNTNPTLAGSSPQLAAPATGLKNVMLKVTPQSGGSGQFVQGFMTSRGLVIPQAALLQQQQQQQGNVILANGSQPGPVVSQQIQPSTVLGGSNQQTIVNLKSQQTVPVGQHIQQQAQKTILAALKSPAPANLSSVADVSNQNASPSVKLMFLNPSIVSNTQTTTSVITGSNLSACQVQTSTPASELVKQIASNSQIHASSQNQYAINPNIISPAVSQQNAVQLLNNIIQGSGVQPKTNANIQNVVNAQTAVNPQLAAQILALQQQNNQIQQLPNIVLKTSQGQGITQTQSKPSVVALQLQQLGQIFSNIGVNQLQTASIPQQQVASVQQQIGARVVQQPNQVLQLAINPQTGNQTIVATPQTSQVVRVGGQLSPQVQLTNQGVGKIHPQGNIAIQKAPHQQSVFQQPASQSIIIQAGASQSGVSSTIVNSQPNILHTNANQQQLNTIQQQLSRTSPQTFVKSPALIISTAQQSVGGLSQGQQLFNTQPQTPGIVLSSLQSPALSVAPSSANQSQMQFVLNPSVPSLSSSASTNISGVPMPVSKVQSGNLNRIIRADSSILQTNLKPQNSNLHVLTSFSPTNNASSVTVSKSVPQMIMPNSGTGQFLISPVKLAPQAPQPNLISPIKFISPIQGQTSSTVLNPSSSQLVVNNQLANSGLAAIPSQVAVKPAVIYAGQPGRVSDKKEGKIAQILLSQPIGNINSGQSKIIVNNHQALNSTSLASNPSPVSAPALKVVNETSTTLNSKAFLYKIGDQYYSPASNMSSVQQMATPNPIPSSSMATPGVVSSKSKPDVQLLVPPAFIEASDQILQLNSKSTIPQGSTSQLLQPAGFGTTSGTVSTNSVSSQNLQQIAQKGAGQAPTIKTSNTANSLQAPGSVNGVHQGSTPFSFSLSGPAFLNTKNTASTHASDGLAVLNNQISSSAINQTNNRTLNTNQNLPLEVNQLLSRPQPNPQNQNQLGTGPDPLSNSGEGISPRRNTFSGCQEVPSGPKGTTLQRHLSADDSVLSVDEQNEKEAALNLLTLANQPI